MALLYNCGGTPCPPVGTSTRQKHAISVVPTLCVEQVSIGPAVAPQGLLSLKTVNFRNAWVGSTSE